MYEFATEDQQKYKEGKVILERALVTEMDGLDGDLAPDDSSNEWLFTKFYNCKLIYSAGELLTQVSRNCYALATYEHYFQTLIFNDHRS